MTFARTIRAITLEAIEEVKKADAEIARLQKEEQAYYKPTFVSLMEKAQEKRQTILLESKRRVTEETSKFKNTVHQRYVPNGEDMTPDAALLTSAITLSGSDLEALMDKHSGNQTMQRILYEYANKNGISIDRHYVSEQEMMEAADSMVWYFNNAMQRPEYSDIWSNEEWFEDAVPECIKGE